MAREGSKRSVAIEVMKANADKAMAEVVVLIADAIGVPEANAKSYYRWIVENGMAPGVVEKAGRGRKAVTLACPQPKVEKAPKLTKAQRQAAMAETKSPDEIAQIKAANLARMKQVTAKVKKYNQVARPEGPGVENFDPIEARAEVDAILAGADELPSFRNPESLTADEVRALI